MTIVDNFDQVRGLLKFDDNGDWFYHVQILIRRKDIGTTIKKNCHVVKSFYIASPMYYDDHIEQIKTFCRMFHARAYIRLNPASWKKCCLKALGEIATYIESNQCVCLRKLTDELAGKYNANPEGGKYQKTWIVDVDSKDEKYLADVEAAVMECLPLDPDRIVTRIPTLHGTHVIVKPFDVRNFSQKFPEIDIHKNNPTLLYFESED